MFKVVRHEETDWGPLFAIVRDDGEVIGLDRHYPARQRCAALNDAARAHQRRADGLIIGSVKALARRVFHLP